MNRRESMDAEGQVVPEVLSIGEKRVVLMRDLIDFDRTKIAPLLAAFGDGLWDADIERILYHDHGKAYVRDLCARLAMGDIEVEALADAMGLIGWIKPEGFDRMSESPAEVDFDLASKRSYKAFTKAFDVTTGLLATTPVEPSGERGVTAILVGMAGSLRGETARSFKAVDVLAKSLERAGKPFEVLAFTTRNWKGGIPSAVYAKAVAKTGTVARHSGRMCELMHVVVKHVDGKWGGKVAKAAKEFFADEGLLKENVDGEALAWAASRVPGGRIVHVSDKVTPIEESSLGADSRTRVGAHVRNTFLLDHMHAVLEADGDEDFPEVMHVDVKSAPYDEELSPFARENSYRLDDLADLVERLEAGSAAPALK